jgi:hypothetical protein
MGVVHATQSEGEAPSDLTVEMSAVTAVSSDFKILNNCLSAPKNPKVWSMSSQPLGPTGCQ